jgi:hypothetical protein
MGIELAAASVISTGASFASGRKAAKAQKRANVVQRNIQLERDRQQKQIMLARTRALRAQQRNLAMQVGTEAGSASMGAVGALASSAAGNVATMASEALNMDVIGGLQQKAADYQSDADLFGVVSSISGTFAQGMDGFAELGQGAEKLFTAINPFD